MTKYRFVSEKFMRCGYTTGSCAAAAAKAACEMLFSQAAVRVSGISLPDGSACSFEVTDVFISPEKASCAVKKDGGDDPDVTDGALIHATVTRISEGIKIDGGEGVGRVTKPGLDQPVGNAAINSAPRKMIQAEVSDVCGRYGYTGGISVVISVPGGEELARRTFNSRLGIEGGISILGTSGIVEPMSNQAVVGAIRAELQVLAAAGNTELLVTVGNFAERFSSDVLRLTTDCFVKCGNFIGETLNAAAELGFKNILVVGHIGKLVKLGIGITNTHSACGDGRRETLIACALRAGASLENLRRIDGCVTTEAAVGYLRGFGFFPEMMNILGELIDDTLKRQVPEETRVGFICFLDDTILTQSENARDVLNSLRNKE